MKPRRHHFITIFFSFVSATALLMPSTTHHRQTTPATTKQQHHRQLVSLQSSKDDEESSLLTRFTAPKIDDPGLPLSDGLVAQVIAPSLQIGARLALHIPPPSWLQSTDPTMLFNNRPGGLLAPTLLHGAALAVAWITAALAAKAYERDAISPVKRQESWDYSTVFLRLFQAGAGAAGIWILATQLEIYFDVGGYVQWGDSTETDGRLIIAATESVADFIFEAVTISFWRLYLAYQTERMNLK